MSNSKILSPANTRQAKAVLHRLRVADPCIEACALISADGRLVVADLDEATNGDRFSAMCAALIALATRAGDEARRGDLRQLILEGESGTMLLTRAGIGGVLVVATSPKAMLGRNIISARDAATELGLLFGA